MASKPAIVFATFHPRQDKVGEVRALLDTMIEHTRAEPGCERYDLYQSGEDQVSFHLFERYRDAEALEEHRAAQHYKDYRAAIPDLLASPIEVAVLSEVDVANP